MSAENCPAHQKVGNLSNFTVKLCFAKATSVLQPLDQGFFKNFKVLCRKLLLTSVGANSVASSDNLQLTTEFSKTTNVLGVVLRIAGAWDKINKLTHC
jgi:hypothetical protein